MKAKEAAVEINSLTKEFHLGKTVVPALSEVTFSITKGSFFCIIGPSGSGKSTLLNLIGGLDKPAGGKIIVNAVDLAKLNEHELAEYRLKNVGFVFQFFNLIPTLTALKNVELPLVFAGAPLKERHAKAKEALASVGLGNRLNHKPPELSGGEQQRVSLARALINEPQIILADEPTGNLDTQTGREIMKILDELNIKEDKTIILVTHDLEVSRYADYIIHLRDGKIEKTEVLRREGEDK